MGHQGDNAQLGLHVIRALAALDAFDRKLFQRLTRRERRLPDLLLKRLSNTANRSLLWLGIAQTISNLGYAIVATVGAGRWAIYAAAVLARAGP